MKSFINIIVGFIACFLLVPNLSPASSDTLFLKSEYNMKDSRTGKEVGTFKVERFREDFEEVLTYKLSDKSQNTASFVKLAGFSQSTNITPEIKGSNLPKNDSLTSGLVVFSQLMSLLPINKYVESSSTNSNYFITTQLSQSVKDLDEDQKNIHLNFSINLTRAPFQKFSYNGEIVCWISPSPSKDDADKGNYYLDKFEAKYSNDSGKEFSYLVESTKD